MIKTLLNFHSIDENTIIDDFENENLMFSTEMSFLKNAQLLAPQDVIDYAIKRIGELNDSQKETSLIDF